jgi:hypothetical protein
MRAGGRVQQLVREIGESAGGREFLAHDRDLGVPGGAPGLTKAMEVHPAQVEDRLGAGSVSLFGEHNVGT